MGKPLMMTLQGVQGKPGLVALCNAIIKGTPII
jgi:hypothetical protein